MGGFAEWRLPSVTLDKEFAEGKLAFAECNRHSAKPVNPVVAVVMLLVLVANLGRPEAIKIAHPRSLATPRTTLATTPRAMADLLWSCWPLEPILRSLTPRSLSTMENEA